MAFGSNFLKKSYDDGHSANYITCTDSNIIFNIGDNVLIKQDENVYSGQIISVSEEGALEKCMKRGTDLGNGLKSEMNSYIPGRAF